jgi:hypothetical protein
MKLFPFDPHLVEDNTQLFPDDICLDPYVVYHGTSSIHETQIDIEGLHWTPGLVSKEHVLRLTRVFEEMTWCGVTGGGYPVLEGFARYDFRSGSQKPIFLAESSYRAMLYAGADWCGGETARATRLALTDLREYLNSESVRTAHREEVQRESDALRERGAASQMSASVDLAWLRRQIDEFAELSAHLDSLHRQHSHGVVYAVRFERDQTASVRAHPSMGLEVKSVSATQLIAKVRVPAEWQYESRQDPHSIRAALSGVFA